MAKFVKRDRINVQRNPDPGQGKHSSTEIFHQLNRTGKRVSQRMENVRREEERSWEKSRVRNSGL